MRLWWVKCLYWLSVVGILLFCEFVGKKAKGQISKWWFQENKALQIFRKTNILPLDSHTYPCVHQGVRNVHFSKNFVCLVFLLLRFWDLPFYLITDELPILVLDLILLVNVSATTEIIHDTDEVFQEHSSEQDDDIKSHEEVWSLALWFVWVTRLYVEAMSFFGVVSVLSIIFQN